MNKTSKIVFLLILMLVSVVPVAEAAMRGHTTCTDCHEGTKKMTIPDITELCLRCHPSNINDHKLGVIPREIPKGLPLDRENRITCITCHEPHGRGTTGNLLRLEQNRLCISCHPV